MSVNANYKLLLDVNSDETYELELPLEKIEWSNGMSGAYDTVGDVTQMQATINNGDGSLGTDIFRDYPPGERVETLGAERLTNPSFDGITGWSTYGTGTATQVDSGENHTGSGTGAENLYATVGQYVAVYQNSILEAWKQYEITIVVSYHAGNSHLYLLPLPSVVGSSPLGDGYAQIDGTGTFTFRVDKLNASGFYLYIQNDAFTSVDVTIDSVSVKEIIVSYSDNILSVTPDITIGDDILSNGTFTSWSAGTPVNWSESGGTTEVGSGQGFGGGGTGSANLRRTGSIPNLETLSYSASAYIARSVYKVIVSVSYVGTNSYVDVFVSPSNSQNTAMFRRISAVGTYTFYFTNPEASNTVSLIFYAKNESGTTDITIDYVELRPVTLVRPPDNLTQVRKGMLCKVVAEYMELTQQLWIGKVFQFNPTPSQNGDRKISLVCKDPMDKMRDSDFRPNFNVNKTIDFLLDEMFGKTPLVTFPHASDFWILGTPGASELGFTTVLFDGAPTNFDVGSSTVPFSGDNSDRETVGTSDTKDLTKQGVSQLGFIRDCMNVELDGRFFWDGRNSEFVLQNRHFDYLSSASNFILDNFVSGSFIGSSDVFNDITIHYQPRTTGSALTTVYQHPVEIHISPGQTANLTVRYRDANDNSARIGARDLLQPVPGLDIIANEQSGGGGTDATDKVHASVQFGGQSAKVILLNDSTIDIYVTTFRLRGTPLTTFTPETFNLKDGTSIRLNDIQPMNYNASMISDFDTAQLAAEFFLSRYKNSIRRFEKVTFLAQTNDTLMRKALTTEIGTRITVKDDFVKHNQDYTVVGEQHSIDFTTWQHYVTWTLKPNSNLNYWILGDETHSVLNVSTFPVY